VSDPGLCDDVVGAFIIVWYGLFMAMLLLDIFKDDVASSVGVSMLSFLLGFLLCCWRWRRSEQRRFRLTEAAISRSFYE
jgi:Flp pilus assembly protein TadB